MKDVKIQEGEPATASQPSLAFQCPKCQFPRPEVQQHNNPSPDRWFECPSCGYRWSVSPLSDS